MTAVTRSVKGENLILNRDKRIEEAFKSCLETFKPSLVHFHCVQRLSVGAVTVTREAAFPIC